MKISKAQIRQIIKEEILREAGDDLSNSDFTKGLKAGAADLASDIPAKLNDDFAAAMKGCLLYTSPSPRDGLLSRMPSSA